VGAVNSGSTADEPSPGRIQSVTVENRLTEIERRLDALEAHSSRPAPPTQRRLAFAGGFMPGEKVTPTVAHPAREIETPACTAVRPLSLRPDRPCTLDTHTPR